MNTYCVFWALTARLVTSIVMNNAWKWINYTNSDCVRPYKSSFQGLESLIWCPVQFSRQLSHVMIWKSVERNRFPISATETLNKSHCQTAQQFPQLICQESPHAWSLRSVALLCVQNTRLHPPPPQFLVPGHTSVYVVVPYNRYVTNNSVLFISFSSKSYNFPP